MMAARCAAGLRQWRKKYMCVEINSNCMGQACGTPYDAGLFSGAAV
jgi:hypothetical protein